MLRNRVLSSLLALGTLGLFSLTAIAQDGAKPADKMAAGGKMAAGAKKPAPARDAKGRFVKAGGEKMATAGGKMAGGDKMASGSKMPGGDKMAAGKPVWNAKANRWTLNGKFISEDAAKKLGAKK